MKGTFPRLEAIYDPNRKNDTRYGGAIILKRMWDYLDCDRLISSAGIRKRSGVPAGCLAFNYVLKPSLMQRLKLHRMSRQKPSQTTNLMLTLTPSQMSKFKNP